MLLSSMMRTSFSAPDQSWLTLLMSLTQDDHPGPSGLKVDARLLLALKQDSTVSALSQAAKTRSFAPE